MDEYWDRVREWWPTIHRAYSAFEAKRPVILVVIDEAKVYAYPREEFKKELSTRSQGVLDEQYREAENRNEIVVFVRDDTRKKLVSYNCPWKHPVKRSKKPNKAAAGDGGREPASTDARRGSAASRSTSPRAEER